MEIRINTEIRAYREGLLLGLSPRQCLFGALTIACTVGVRMLLGGVLGKELAGWVGIALGTPCAAMGFVTYNGMPAEKAAAAIVKSVLYGSERLYRSENYLLREVQLAELELAKKRRKRPKKGEKLQ